MKDSDFKTDTGPIPDHNSNSNPNNNAGRAQGQQNQNNGPRKSQENPPAKTIPKYDTTKIPTGLSTWSDVTVDPKVRQLINKHFEKENIVIQSPEGTSDRTLQS